jgi:exoribonuclease R
MLERGLLPDFSQVLAELVTIHAPEIRAEESTRDLRHLIWCSIDNDTSRDLEQLTVAEAMPEGAVKIVITIAAVDCMKRRCSEEGRTTGRS